MVSFRALFVAATTALVGSAAANEAAGAKLPVFFFHGATGNNYRYEIWLRGAEPRQGGRDPQQDAGGHQPGQLRRAVGVQ
ncbi:hypothetical protein ON010_g2040 [Phytophthora cinnamomi]|nr:hypothetical protein ON010_g2040 [Phytophthora cinnamomi]